MRGEFDDALQWSFRGTIKLELVDQSLAGKHSFTIVDETSHTDEGNGRREVGRGLGLYGVDLSQASAQG